MGSKFQLELLLLSKSNNEMEYKKNQQTLKEAVLPGTDQVKHSKKESTCESCARGKKPVALKNMTTRVEEEKAIQKKKSKRSRQYEWPSLRKKNHLFGSPPQTLREPAHQQFVICTQGRNAAHRICCLRKIITKRRQIAN